MYINEFYVNTLLRNNSIKKVVVNCNNCSTEIFVDRELFNALSLDEFILNDGEIITCPTCGNTHSHEQSIKTESSQYIPRCPTCQSPNIERLSVGQKVVSGGMFGLLSGRVKKSFHCNNCKYEW